jgi:hypothetical protein
MVKCKRELEGANASEVVHPATKSEAIEADVCELRERFVSLGPDAVLGVQKAIRGGTGGSPSRFCRELERFLFAMMRTR